jgi:hypothetical protein
MTKPQGNLPDVVGGLQHDDRAAAMSRCLIAVAIIPMASNSSARGSRLSTRPRQTDDEYVWRERSVLSGVGRRDCGWWRRSRRSVEGFPVIGRVHHPLPLSQRHVGVLRPIVKPLMRPVFDSRHHLSPGCPIGAKLVGDHALRLLLQQSRH